MKILADFFKKKDFKDLKVAIVGNGPIDGYKGNEIDNYPYVVRINNFQLGDVAGQKVDMCFLNSSSQEAIPISRDYVNVLVNYTKCIPEEFIDNIFFIPKDRVEGFRKKLSVSEGNNILTGVLAVLEFIYAGAYCNLFGFDFYKSGNLYYFENTDKVSKEHMKNFHQLDKEQKFIVNHPQVVVH